MLPGSAAWDWVLKLEEVDVWRKPLQGLLGLDEASVLGWQNKNPVRKPHECKSLCGGGVPSSHPSVLSVFFPHTTVSGDSQVSQAHWARSRHSTHQGTARAEIAASSCRTPPQSASGVRSAHASFWHATPSSERVTTSLLACARAREPERKKENTQPKGGMGGRHAATTHTGILSK